MGRRSINTTKSGKYMNPTDQARKEARKKELKKNKKQRQMVRAAVLKGKDPVQIIAEMEKIDQMEYNVLQPPPLNEKVLKDKRKKLRETLDRVMSMYDKDDPEKWAELKRMEVDYEKRRATMVTFAESVRNAQQVVIDDIPLPSLQHAQDPTLLFMGLPSQIPLPVDLPLIPLPTNLISSLAGVPLPPSHGILKKTSAYAESVIVAKPKNPPGVPPGIPPDLSEDEDNDEIEEEISQIGEKIAETSNVDERSEKPKARQRTIRFADDSDSDKEEEEEEDAKEDSDEEIEDRNPTPPGEEDLEKEDNDSDEEDRIKRKKRKRSSQPSNLQQKMLAMAGQDIDLFMQEMEEVHRKREMDLRISETDAEEEERSKSNPEPQEVTAEVRLQAQGSRSVTDVSQPPPPVIGSSQPSNAPPCMVPPVAMPLGMMFRPPPNIRPLLTQGLRIPPGPPPVLPPGPPPGLPPRLRLPPGPPPGMPPPRLLRPPGPPPRLPSGVAMALPQQQINAIPVPPPMVMPMSKNVLTAAPQLIKRDDSTNINPGLAGMDGKKAQGATIEAKPQIRNLSADVTRFLPTALRVKREDKKKKDVKITAISDLKSDVSSAKPGPVSGQQTKDDAYMQFMREMEGLL